MTATAPEISRLFLHPEGVYALCGLFCFRRFLLPRWIETLRVDLAEVTRHIEGSSNPLHPHSDF